MQRVVPALLVHFAGEQAVRLHHDERVGCLHGEDEVVVVVLAADARKLKGALDHALGRVAEVRERPCAEASVVGSDANRASHFLALEHERRERLLDVVELALVVRGVLVGDFLELLASVGVVSRVDSDLLEGVRHLERRLGVEVDVRDERRVVSILEESVSNFHRRFRLPESLHGDAHHLRASVRASLRLVDCGLHVSGVCGEHGLFDDGVFGSHLDVPDGDGSRLSPKGSRRVVAVRGDQDVRRRGDDGVQER